jgi:uncharacterized protein (DUF1697 family)
MHPATSIALLRGVNVGGRNRVPMAELRLACTQFGWNGVQSYIQSGNVIFSAKGRAAAFEQELEREIEGRFGLSIPVIVRSGDEWSVLTQGNPFADASRTDPNRVMLAISRKTPNPTALEEMRARAVNGERVARVGDALWIDFARGVAKSKLSPGLLDRIAGSPVTMRNWRTVLQLDEMAQSVGRR